MYDYHVSFNQPLLSPENVSLYAAAIHNRGAPPGNCWGFVDGTVRLIGTPKRNQRELYIGHKRVHVLLKYQSVVSPNSLIANLYGSLEGKRHDHDSRLLAMSGLLQKLQQHSYSPTGGVLCLYGDSANPHRSISQVRVAVEWVFGDVANYCKFIEFKKNLKIGLRAIGKFFVVCALLKNCLTCLYGNT